MTSIHINWRLMTNFETFCPVRFFAQNLSKTSKISFFLFFFLKRTRAEIFEFLNNAFHVCSIYIFVDLNELCLNICRFSLGDVQLRSYDCSKFLNCDNLFQKKIALIFGFCIIFGLKLNLFHQIFFKIVSTSWAESLYVPNCELIIKLESSFKLKIPFRSFFVFF
jgi:hypothetical protein